MAATKTFSGARLERIRVTRKLTQHDLASRLRTSGFGTTQTTISRWEAGQKPHSGVLPALADALGVEMSELFAVAGDDDEESSSVALPPVSLDDYLRLRVREILVEERNDVRVSEESL